MNQLPDSVTSGLYYKFITNINDDSSVVNELEFSLIDDARVVIYDHYMFIVQAIDGNMGFRYVLQCVFVKSHITANIK
jgi:hypothetical protein